MGKTSVESLRSYIKYSQTQIERYEKDYSRARHIIASEKEMHKKYGGHEAAIRNWTNIAEAAKRNREKEKENIKNLREQIRKLNGE